MTDFHQRPTKPNALTAARITPVGRGAVASVRVIGESNGLNVLVSRLFFPRNGRRIEHQEIGRIVFGTWGRVDGEHIVAVRLDKDRIEFHCHGGDAAVSRLLSDLDQSGIQIVDAFQQWSSTTSTIDMECLEATSRATTLRTADILLEQSSGILQSAFDELTTTAKSLVGNADKIESESPSLTALIQKIEALLQWAEFGIHLTEPWNVVLTGRPNVGKSSLLNRLLGYDRAIVFDKPGTTRDIVTGETAFDGWPVRLADTAGLRSASHSLEAAGIEKAVERIQSADLCLLLIDVSQPPTSEDRSLVQRWPESLVIAHKCDCDERWDDELPTGVIKVSSKTGEGIADLQKELVRRLVPNVPFPGTPIPISRRQVDFLRHARDAASMGNVGRLL